MAEKRIINWAKIASELRGSLAQDSPEGGTEQVPITVLSDHIQALILAHESSINKNTAYNKDFGMVAGTVAEGDHLHDLSNYVEKTGDTMTGNLDLGGNSIKDVDEINPGSVAIVSFGGDIYSAGSKVLTRIDGDFAAYRLLTNNVFDSISTPLITSATGVVSFGGNDIEDVDDLTLAGLLEVGSSMYTGANTGGGYRSGIIAGGSVFFNALSSSGGGSILRAAVNDDTASRFIITNNGKVFKGDGVTSAVYSFEFNADSNGYNMSRLPLEVDGYLLATGAGSFGGVVSHASAGTDLTKSALLGDIVGRELNNAFLHITTPPESATLPELTVGPATYASPGSADYTVRHLVGFTYGSSLVCTVAGWYMVASSNTLSNDTVNTTTNIYVAKNWAGGAPTADDLQSLVARETDPADKGNVGSRWLVELAVGDSIDLVLNADNNSVTTLLTGTIDIVSRNL